MAEFVGYQQELMLPVYEEMRKKKLATNLEIREVIRNRESYEYKIARQSRTLKDFGEYIIYEKNLLKMMGEREKEMQTGGENSGRRNNSVANFISLHIKDLFKQAVHHFPEDIRLWESFINFCIQRNYYVDVANIYEKYLQYHGDKSDIWLRSVTWESNQTGNMEKVKDILLRAVQRHPDDKALHLKFFKVMLDEAAKMNTEIVVENRLSERDLGLKRVEVIYNNSRQKICDLQYLIDILNILDEYTFTKNLQRIVITDMKDAFPRNELTWHTFALRELRGLNMADLFNENSENTNEPQEMPAPIVEPEMDEDQQKPLPITMQRTLKKRIELCCGVYTIAVQTIKTETMWSYYINTMLELNRDLKTQAALKRRKLSDAFKGAFEANLMSAVHFESYIELLKESETKTEILEEIMKKGTIVHPNCVKIWELWMEYYAIEDRPEKVNEIFRNSTKVLGEKGYPLWLLIIRYYQIRVDPPLHKIDQIFRDATAYTTPNFLKFRVMFLEWTLLVRNIERTRVLYDELTKLPPPYYEMHSTMTLLESKQIVPNIERWRKCYEDMVGFFGKERTDVWINYIKFERDHGNPKNIAILYDRAKGTLNEDLITKFITEHSYLTTGIM